MIIPTEITILNQTYHYMCSCNNCGMNHLLVCMVKSDTTIPDLQDTNDIPDIQCPKCYKSM